MITNSGEDFLYKVEETIKKYKMADKSERLLLGLSGGADSTALLLCLHELGYSVAACHVNHCLRGAESDRDEAFCISLCKKYDVQINVKRINVREYCTANSLSEEEGARILRYKAFSEIAADKICTAHTLNDCLETTIFNLARGSGLKGLSSIPPVRDNIVRPLINCSREEIEDYLAVRGQPFVTDSTNLRDEYSRNKIRHGVVPVLEQINSSLFKTFSASVSYLREDSSYLEGCADTSFLDCKTDLGYDLKKLCGLDFSIRRRVIMRILTEQGIDASNDKICQTEILAAQGGKVNMKKNLFAVSDGSVLSFQTQCKGERLSHFCAAAPINGMIVWQGREISLKIAPVCGGYENVNKKFANSCLDYDKIKGEIVLRQRLSGDKIRLVNRDFSSDVKKLIKAGFSPDERSKALLLADDEGVIWLEGSGAADRVKIDDNTENMLLCDIKTDEKMQD